MLTDVVTDPTLPRTNTVECPKCNHGEAVFFQSTSRNDAEAMTLFFVCSSCGERWATCHVREQSSEPCVCKS